tara:strand:- start:2057 stop:3847 length:1791 start_codon:yes stop_codon:yes gene_type:complete
MGIVVNSTTGQIDLSASTAGTYTVVYTVSGVSFSQQVTIDGLPTVSASASASTVCAGQAVSLSATGASTYTWSDGQTGASVSVTPSTTTTYTVTGVDSNGCSATSSSVTVTVNALPTVEISGTLTYCAGGDTTLTATAGLSSYLWSTGATTQAITVSTAGSYTVTGTDSNGCSATSSAAAVTESAADTATVTYSSNAYCQMPTGATAVQGYYPLYTTASAANAVSSDGTNHTHVLGGVTYYMPNAGVIQYHNTYSLTTPAPTVTGQSGAFSESTGNLSIDSSTGVINVNSSTAGNYTVVYTTNGSCPITVNNTVTINALDGATFGYSASSLAQTGTASLTTTPTTSGGVYSAYPSGLSINSSTGEIDLANSTIQSYKIFYETSGAGCPNSSTFDLAVTAAGIANNYSMSFDGVNDYIKADTISSLNSATQATISFWAKRVSGQPFYVGDWVDASNSFHLEYYSPNNSIYFVPRNGSGGFNINYAQSFDTNWHHYVGVYDGSNVSNCKLYVDGVDVGANSGALNSSLSSVIGNNFTIGAMGSPTYYGESSIDEVAVWNTALTSTQIQSIYDAKGTNLTKDLTTVSGSNLIYWNRMGD